MTPIRHQLRRFACLGFGDRGTGGVRAHRASHQISSGSVACDVVSIVVSDGYSPASQYLILSEDRIYIERFLQAPLGNISLYVSLNMPVLWLGETEILSVGPSSFQFSARRGQPHTPRQAPRRTIHALPRGARDTGRRRGGGATVSTVRYNKPPLTETATGRKWLP